MSFHTPIPIKHFMWVICAALSWGMCSRVSLKQPGNEVIRVNYPGDIGLHVVKWLWNYLKYHKGEKPDKDITRWMGTVYAEAIKRLEQDPELEKEVREVYTLWDQRDPEVVALLERNQAVVAGWF